MRVTRTAASISASEDENHERKNTGSQKQLTAANTIHQKSLGFPLSGCSNVPEWFDVSVDLARAADAKRIQLLLRLVPLTTLFESWTRGSPLSISSVCLVQSLFTFSLEFVCAGLRDLSRAQLPDTPNFHPKLHFQNWPESATFLS